MDDVENLPILAAQRVCVDRVLPDSWESAAQKWAAAENPENTGSAIPMPASMAVVRSRKWQPGRTLRVKFIGGAPAVRQKVFFWAKHYEQFANIKFEQVTDSADAEIRIAFEPTEGSWSYVGTDILTVPRNLPTMNFGWLTPTSSDQDYSSVVLHEFGHALGCIHEHQSPAGGIPWDKDVVYRDLSGPPNRWSKAQIDANMFTQYNQNQTQFTDLDPASIMMYSFPSAWTGGKLATRWNTVLSPVDKSYIAAMYPRENAPAPDPQPVAPPSPPAPDPSPPPETGTVPGTRAEGVLRIDGNPRTCQINTGEIAQFTFQVTRRARYMLGTGGQQDLLAEIYTQAGQRVAQDDDGGVGENAMVVAALDPGNYVAAITCKKKVSRGLYSIAIRKR